MASLLRWRWRLTLGNCTFRLNLSKGSASLSIGTRGLHAVFSPKYGVRATASAIGTGFSFSTPWLHGLSRCTGYGCPVPHYPRTGCLPAPILQAEPVEPWVDEATARANEADVAPTSRGRGVLLGLVLLGALGLLGLWFWFSA